MEEVYLKFIRLTYKICVLLHVYARIIYAHITKQVDFTGSFYLILCTWPHGIVDREQ